MCVYYAQEFRLENNKRLNRMEKLQEKELRKSEFEIYIYIWESE